MDAYNKCIFKCNGVGVVERERTQKSGDNLPSQITVSAKSKVLLAYRLCEGRKHVISLVCAPEQTNVDE